MSTARLTPDTPRISLLGDPADVVPPARQSGGAVTKPVPVRTKPARRSARKDSGAEATSEAAESAAPEAATTVEPSLPKAPVSEVREDAALPEPELLIAEGESKPGEEKVQRTVNLPVSLIERAQAVVWHAQMTAEPEEIETMADLARVAIHRYITEIEQTYNNGDPLPVPKRGLGRGPGRASSARSRAARAAGAGR